MHFINALCMLPFLLIMKKTVGLDHVVTLGFPIPRAAVRGRDAHGTTGGCMGHSLI